MIEVRNVVKRYRHHLAVDGVSFRAHPGEIFGLLGPNGAGKTTIIRMIMNILTPDSGEVLFDGRPVAERDKNRIGYLPEERGLYRRQTVTEVLTYLAALKGVPSSQSAAAIRSWLARFDLADWHDRRVDQLSREWLRRCSSSPRWFTIPRSCSSTNRSPASTRSSPTYCAPHW